MISGDSAMPSPLLTQRLVLLSPASVESTSLLNYLRANRVFHQPWEPTRDENYYTMPGVETLLAKQCEDIAAGSAIHYYLTKEGDSEIIGKVSCSQIVPYPFHSTFVGYSLSHTHTHQGYMREALDEVVSLGSLKYNLHRFEANIMPGNRASINVATSVGFILEGYSPDYLMIQGVWQGHEHYVYLNNRWGQA